MSQEFLNSFDEVWFLDFEYGHTDGNPVEPRCLCAKELKTGRRIEIWLQGSNVESPFRNLERSVFIGYYVLAELSCFHALGWPVPLRWIDLFVEFKNLTNGVSLPEGRSLIGALSFFKIDAINAQEKEELRALALRGGAYTDAEIKSLLEYCMSDVVALERLFPKLFSYITRDALLRGQYLRELSFVEYRGVPINTALFDELKSNWKEIQRQLIADIDSAYSVYDGLSFKKAKFKEYLMREQIAWPTLASGDVDLKDQTFREMASVHPRLQPLRDLRSSLSKMRLSEISVGTDGRNRCGLSPFRSKTSRNQPSNSKFIFGSSSWLRGVITPAPKTVLCYIDYSQQEFGVAAALSHDPNMIEAYRSGDPYLEFAKQVNAVPQDATKASHPTQRELFKQCVLAVQYGMGPESLAAKIKKPPVYAEELLELHRQNYRTFWNWSDKVVDMAMAHGRIYTTYGWQLLVKSDANIRSIRNFPMQANGAEILRVAIILLGEAGVRICAPIHDALLIEFDEANFNSQLELAKIIMTDASKIVLDGFEIRSDVKTIRYPDHFMEAKGQFMWDKIEGILAKIRCAQTHRSSAASEQVPVT